MKSQPHDIYWTPDLVSRFWDWQSQFPASYFTHQFGYEIVATLSPYLSGRRTILDYGCGMGFLIQHLLRLNNQVAACDVSEASIKHVNSTFSQLPNFLGADTISNLTESQQRFDAVISVEVIEHLYDEQLDEMLSNIRKLLLPGGIFIITTPNEENLRLNQVYCPESNAVFHRWQHVRSWSSETLQRYLENQGFKTTKFIKTNFAAVPSREITSKMKWALKSLLGLYKGTPHLVCIASL